MGRLGMPSAAGAFVVLFVLMSAVDALPGRTLVPEVIDMGVTGRRAAGPGPAGVSGESDVLDGLTLALTPAPTANNYQHVQGGFVRSEPAGHQPHSEDDLQSGLRRRKRADDQEAAATDDDEVAGPAAPASAAEHGADDGDMFLEPDGADAAAAPSPTGEPAATPDTTGQPQNLFPAFQPLFPLGHSRPTIFQEPSFNQRQALIRPQYNAFHGLERLEPRLELPAVHPSFRERAYPQAASLASPSEVHSNALLGSGNFGVIHGGTFYGDEKEGDYDGPSSSPLHSYFGGNGHGRPSFYRGNPEPQRYRTAEDFFANFRDFADISTPTKSSFSEYYVVYVNRNASRDEHGTVVGPRGVAPTAEAVADQAVHQVAVNARPNNIFERLAQIDREHGQQQHEQHHLQVDAEVPKKKLSLGKRKLALLKKKSAGKKARDPVQEVPRDAQEPLLALS